MTHPASHDATRTRPVATTTTVHLGAEHVSATDLTDYNATGQDLAALTLGDDTNRIVVLATLPTLQAIVRAAGRHLDGIHARRQTTRH